MSQDLRAAFEVLQAHFGLKSLLALANHLDIGNSTLNTAMKRNSMTRTTAEKIAQRSGCSLEWLTNGHGDPFPNPQIEFSNSHVKTQTIPVVAFVQAGCGITEERVIENDSIQFPSFMLPHGNVIATEVTGDSMEPEFAEGSHVFLIKCDPDLRLCQPKKPYVVVSEQGAQLKHVKKNPNGSIQLTSINPLYPPFEVTHVYKCYEVVGNYKRY